MPVTIENKTDSRVLLRLNSGLTRHLGPREAVEVESVEVKGNAGIQRLEERKLIAVQSPEARKAEAQEAARETPAEEPEGDEESQPRARRGRAQQ